MAQTRGFVRRVAGLGGQARGWIARRPVWASICVAYTALRLIQATTHPAGVTPDSAVFLGGMTGTSRPPFVPFVYAVLGEDIRRIAIVQGLVGAVCWLVLADVASHWARTTWARRTLVVSVLVIGLCDIVDRWDSSMLSESIAISLGVLLIACVARVWERQTTARIAAVLVVAAAWALTRDIDGVFLLVVAIAWWAYPPSRRLRLAAPAGLAALAIFAAVSGALTGRSAVSFDDVIGVRVLTDPQQQAFFLRHGMPTTVERLRGRLANEFDPHDPFITAPDLAGFRHWASRDGRFTYLAYALQHPDWSIVLPLRSPETLGGPVANPPLSSYGGPGYESLLPTEAQRVLFEDKPAALVIEVLAVATVIAISRTRRGVQAPSGLPLALTVLAVAHALLAWHGDTLEIGRHAITAAVALRLGLVMSAVVHLDVLQAPESRPAAVETTP